MFILEARRKASLAAAIAAAATIFLSGSSLAADHRVRYSSLIPQILWCRGCTPTSASMALGYWDNYVPGVSYVNLGSGRMIDFWRDLSENSDGSGRTRNVPNTHLELLKAMYTSSAGSTHINCISTGIRRVANSLNYYGYLSKLYMGGRANDRCWTIIKREIAHNRPFVWSVGTDTEGHSLCAWGYTDKKYVITYNTWNYGREDWYYRRYDNGDTTVWQCVNTVIPAKLQGTEGLFIRPLSGTTFAAGSRVNIRWRQYGTLIARVAVYCSFDGGRHWVSATTRAHTRPGNYYYRWTVPDRPSTRCRIRILGYHGTSYIAGDGVKKNFEITGTAGGS